MIARSTLRHVVVGVALTFSLAACSSATTPTVAPSAAGATAATAALATPTASLTAAPTAAAAATATPPAGCQQYSREDVVQRFTQEFGLTFGAEKSAQAGDTVYVDALSTDKIQVLIANRAGSLDVVSLDVFDFSGRPTISQEAIFALTLIGLSGEANVWVQSEFDKAYADRNTYVDDSNKSFACKVDVLSNLNSPNPERNSIAMYIYPRLSTP